MYVTTTLLCVTTALPKCYGRPTSAVVVNSFVTSSSSDKNIFFSSLLFRAANCNYFFFELGASDFFFSPCAQQTNLPTEKNTISDSENNNSCFAQLSFSAKLPKLLLSAHGFILVESRTRNFFSSLRIRGKKKYQQKIRINKLYHKFSAEPTHCKAPSEKKTFFS